MIFKKNKNIFTKLQKVCFKIIKNKIKKIKYKYKIYKMNCNKIIVNIMIHLKILNKYFKIQNKKISKLHHIMKNLNKKFKKQKIR